MIREDILSVADLLIQKVDGLERDERRDTVLLMSIYLMRWGGAMLAPTASEPQLDRYQQLANEMERLCSEMRMGRIDPTPDMRNVVPLPKR